MKYIEGKTSKLICNNNLLVNFIKKEKYHYYSKYNMMGWWNQKESIINSFWKTGISLPQDGSADESWEFPKNIIDNYILYDEFENSLKLKFK